ncbi:MAG: nucleoside deaminase [Bacteroidales bacterium]|nr:nucleoside deaminase [Bacteroidales bacterium]
MKEQEEAERRFMLRAAELAAYAVDHGLGGPFRAVVVKDGVIVGEGYNQVTSANDPTAHAEVMAIRNACQQLESFQLTGCEIYSSCEPCPMCLGAIYWARPEKLIYGSTRFDAANAGFDDAFIYHELALPENQRNLRISFQPHQKAVEVFRHWKDRENKTTY